MGCGAKKIVILQNETPTLGHTLFDSQAKYVFPSGLEISLLVGNLLDTEYVNHLYGLNRVARPYIAKGIKSPSAGRNLGFS